MAGLVVNPVTTQREKKQFFDLPWQIYRDDPNWIPPLRDNQRALVGYRSPIFRWQGPHPFYRNADVQTFLAQRDGEPCGRIAAIVNHSHNGWYKERRGFFGFFETYNDPQIVQGLFDAAREWFARRDIRAIRGPTNPSQNYECGMLVKGFDSAPFFMMTYNPRYYGQLLENYGFQKAQDLYAFWGHVDMLSTLDKKLSYISEASAERFNVKLRPLDKTRFRADVELFLDIYNQSLAGSWGFAPLAKAEIRAISGSLRHLIVPELVIFAEVDGRTIGSAFGLLDYNPRIKQIDGRLLPYGFLKLVRNRLEIKRIRLVSTNVVPAYQRWGIGLTMLGALLPNILKWGVEEAEFSWVLETNVLSRGSLEKGGAKLTKIYRIYDYQPDEAKADS